MKEIYVKHQNRDSDGSARRAIIEATRCHPGRNAIRCALWAPDIVGTAEAVIHAAVAEARKRNWKTNVAVADSGGHLVAFERMDGAMLASIQIAIHKARVAANFRRPTKVIAEGINMMHLNYLLAFDDVIAPEAAFH